MPPSPTRQVNVIEDNPDLGRGNLVKLHQFLDSLRAEVHHGMRLGEKNALAIQIGGQLIGHHKLMLCRVWAYRSPTLPSSATSFIVCSQRDGRHRVCIDPVW